MTRKNSPTHLVFLVADDDATVRETVVEYLDGFGYRDVHQAKDGEQALEILNKEKIDFIISDWEMPGKSGLELLQAVRQDPRFEAIPFMMVTSQISQERLKIEKAALSKVSAYIVKPFRAQTFKEKLDSLIPSTVAEKNVSKARAVLLVDDDPGVRGTLTEYLHAIGYPTVLTANDGLSAFRLLEERAQEISFVVSDWEMPHMTGIELLKQVRSDTRFHDLPFLIVTAPQSIERLKLTEAIESEVDHYLLKPVRLQDFRAKIELVLNKSKKELEIREALERADLDAGAARWLYAEQGYNRVLKLQARNIKAYIGLSRIQQHLHPDKGSDKAIQYLRTAMLIDPRCDELYIQLAQIFEKGLSLDRGIAALNDGLKHCAESAQLHYNLGRLLLARGRDDLGMKHVKRALELDPGSQGANQLIEEQNERRRA